MARPTKEGLDYFPLDTDMDNDGKIAFIESKHGFVAFGLIIRLLMRIYKNGYYLEWSEREQYIFSKNISVDINTTLTIVNECINEGLFNKNLYEKFAILTSGGIQKRYITACGRRTKIAMIKEYFLINPGIDDLDLSKIKLKSINVDNNPVYADSMHTETPAKAVNRPAENTQSKVKESKVKENIINNICAREESQPVDNVDNFFGADGTDNLYTLGNAAEETAATLSQSSDQSLELSADNNPDFMLFWNSYPSPSNKPVAIEAWRTTLEKGFRAEHLILAAKKYALKIAKEQTAPQYIKKPYNFLLQGAFAEYIPKNLPGCPVCNGIGHYEVDDGDGPRVATCDCRKVLLGDRLMAVMTG